MKQNDDRSRRRKIDALHDALGPAIRKALHTRGVVEVMVNPDGHIWLDKIGEGCFDSGERIGPEEAETTLRLIASSMGKSLTRHNPRISGVLPETNERVQGEYPPIVEAPAFSIRKPPDVIFELSKYIDDGALTQAQADAIERAVADKKNIIVAGGTGSGKTTFANALLCLPGYMDDRVLIIEDTPELQCSAANRINMLTKDADVGEAVTIRHLVQDSLRLRPDRIVVGEIRDGAAHEVLKAWNTGHPGGLCTIHANSAPETLERLEELIGENPNIARQSEKTVRNRVARTIDLIVFIKRTKGGRTIDDLIEVLGYDEASGYDLHSLKTSVIKAGCVSNTPQERSTA